MALLISGLLFVLLTTVIVVYANRQFVRPARVTEQVTLDIAPLGTGARSRDGASRGWFYGVVNALQWAGEQLPMSAQDAKLTRRRMLAAGYRSDRSVGVYYGLKIISVVVMLVIAVSLADRVTSNHVLAKVIMAAGPVLGFFLPNLVLDFLGDRRRRVLRFALPDALDLLVVGVEAGLGLDQAVRVVSRELTVTHPELCGELSLVSAEMRAGVARQQALSNLAKRTTEPEIQKLVAILVQTDRFGTSMADSLRTHSDFMRVRRRQEAEERANKIGVKLVFPIFFFILPAILVVAAGPALLQVAKQLLPLLREMGQ